MNEQTEYNRSKKDPIQLKSDEFGCPYCKIELVSGKVPMYNMGEIFGYFDGIKCKICGYGLVTEEGYKDSCYVLEHGEQTSTNVMVTIPEYGKTKGEGTNDTSRIHYYRNF